MQYKVPQNVQREDRIVGPLTLKQLVICGIGGFIAYGIYTSLGRLYLWITWLPPVVLVVGLTLAFSFVRPLDLSFGKWILCWVQFSLLPRRRLWLKASGEVLPMMRSSQNTKTKNTITYEYVVWDGINDTKKDVEALIKFCKFAPSKVNLIEYNPIDDGEFRQANSEALEMYISMLEKNNITVTVRRSRGKDIDAACGQLANKA